MEPLLRGGNERILDVAEGSEDRLLVRHGGLFLPGTFDLDLRKDAPAVEDGPEDRGAGGPGSAPPIGVVRGGDAFEVEGAREREPRVELRRRDADPGRRRRELTLRATQIGPAAKEIRRQSYRNLRRNWGDRLGLGELLP